MNREIKFRAWDKVRKEFITEGEVWIYSNGKAWCGDNDNSPYIPLDSDCVQQYTGLKDMNGTEIYEGDILKREIFAFDQYRTFIGEVKIFEGACWIDSGTAAVHLWNEMHELTVIGNIYENIELLEVSQ